MKRAALVSGLVLGSALPLSAQEVPGQREARALASCLGSENEALQRLARLLDEAERRRVEGADEDIRRDAALAVQTLVERIRERTAAVRACLDETRIPSATGANATDERPNSEQAALAHDRGTTHEIEHDEALSGALRVARGERVDGSGSAPDQNVRSALRRVRTRLAICFESASGGAEAQVTFTANEGGRVSNVAVERASGISAQSRDCLRMAFQSITVEGQRGRSVYVYTLRKSR